MDIRTARITKVTPQDSFETQYGTLYPYWLQTENGDEALINKKTPNAFEVGQVVTYTLEEKTSKAGNPYYKMEEVNPQHFPAHSGPPQSNTAPVTDPFGAVMDAEADPFGPPVPERRVVAAIPPATYTMVLSYAKDQVNKSLEVAGHPVPLETIGQKTCQLADMYIAWLEKKM